MPVWETLALDAAGTLVTGAVTLLAGWLLHRKGKLAGLEGRLAGWLGKNSGPITADVLAVLRQLLAHEHAVPGLSATARTDGPGIRQPDVLQGDAGFREAPAGVDPLGGAGGGAGGDVPVGEPTGGGAGG